MLSVVVDVIAHIPVSVCYIFALHSKLDLLKCRKKFTPLRTSLQEPVKVRRQVVFSPPLHGGGEGVTFRCDVVAYLYLGL